jgi:chemotaxis signal transduction protein
MLMPAVKALARQFELAPQAQPAVAKSETRRRGLTIGNLKLLVSHDSGGELIEEVRLHALPRTARWCRGLINLRGHLIPAFDLHECFGLKPTAACPQWWLALGRGDEAVAFSIDALPVMLQAVEVSTVQAAVVPEPLRPYLGKGYRIDGELWLEFLHQSYFRAIAQQVAA